MNARSAGGACDESDANYGDRLLVVFGGVAIAVRRRIDRFAGPSDSAICLQSDGLDRGANSTVEVC